MEDILAAFPDRETFDRYWEENYVPVTYEDVKEAFEDFVTSAGGHIFLSDYEEGGCISKEDFKDNLSQEAQFAFQDGLTEVFYDKNPDLYETAFAISIACICETERFFAKVVTSISKSKSRSRFLVFSIIWFSSTTMPFVWNLPAHILSTTFL